MRSILLWTPIPYKHDLNPFIPLLKRDATYCRVGVGKVVDSNEIGQMNLVLYRNALAGSNTGGIQETQDMVDFCALNKIKPEITKISMNGIDDAWKKFSTSKLGIDSSSTWLRSRRDEWSN